MSTYVSDDKANTQNTNKNSDSKDESLDYNKSSDATFQMGESTNEEEEEEENAADGVYENNPEDNKKLSEITMAEQIRKTFELTVTIPRILKGLHTNQFMFLDVTDDFYEKNYPEIISTIADKKFGRFAGFKKGRFFVEKIEEQGGIDGWSTKVTLNPIPPSLAMYSKMQKEAQKALIHAINEEIALMGGGSGGATNVSGNDCDPNDKYESNHWGGSHRQYPPVCTPESKVIHGNSARQYAKDTAQHNSSSKELVEYVASQCKYVCYADNPKGESACPEKLWTGGRPIGINCADSARLLKCILDVNGYQSIICHIPGHFFNAIWENGDWTICDICQTTCWGKSAYGHANHENQGNCHPIGTWDNPLTEGFTKTSW